MSRKEPLVFLWTLTLEGEVYPSFSVFSHLLCPSVTLSGHH